MSVKSLSISWKELKEKAETWQLRRSSIQARLTESSIQSTEQHILRELLKQAQRILNELDSAKSQLQCSDCLLGSTCTSWLCPNNLPESQAFVIDIRQGVLSDLDCLRTGAALPVAQLTIGNLPNEQITPSGLSPLQVHKHFSEIRKLTLSNLQTISLRGDILSMIPGLQVLEVSSCPTIDSIASVGPNLTQLILQNCSITSLNSLPNHLPNLTKLLLPGNSLSDISALRKMHLPSLQTLDLSRNHLTNLDLEPLSHVQLSSLLILGLRANYVTSLRFLPRIKLSGLRVLDLTDNPVSDVRGMFGWRGRGNGSVYVVRFWRNRGSYRRAVEMGGWEEQEAVVYVGNAMLPYKEDVKVRVQS